MSVVTRVEPAAHEAAARAAVDPAAHGGHRGRTGSTCCPASCCCSSSSIIPLIWNVFLTFTKWRGVRTPRVHRPRELVEALHRRGLLDVVHELRLDGRSRWSSSRRSVGLHRRRAPVRRRRPQVRRQGRQLPAGDLLPAADPPHRRRRHRDRLDRAARAQDGALNQMLGSLRHPALRLAGTDALGAHRAHGACSSGCRSATRSSSSWRRCSASIRSCTRQPNSTGRTGSSGSRPSR